MKRIYKILLAILPGVFLALALERERERELERERGQSRAIIEGEVALKGGSVLRKYRHDARMPRGVLAAYCGLSYSDVFKVETGKGKPRPIKLMTEFLANVR
jgi:hypothetical protein